MGRSKEASSISSLLNAAHLALGRNSDWRCPGRFGTIPLDLAFNLD